MATAGLGCRPQQLSSHCSVVGMVLAIKNVAPNTADTELPTQSSPCQDDQGEREDRMHLRDICVANPLHMAWGGGGRPTKLTANLKEGGLSLIMTKVVTV